MRIRIGRAGMAATEFALVLPALVMLMLGGYDVANAVQTNIRLQRAVRAGAQCALADATSMAAIQAQVIAAWPELTTANVPLPVKACECAGAAAACTQACAGGLVQTVTVTAQRTLSPMLLPNFSTSQGSAVVRLR
jgi:Flp pilus assembly protein TadG